VAGRQAKDVTLTPPLLQSATAAQGGTVTLTWNAVSGAIDYLVYRIAMTRRARHHASTTRQGRRCVRGTGCAVYLYHVAARRAQVSGATGAALYGYPERSGPLGPGYSHDVYGTCSEALCSRSILSSPRISGDLSSPSNVVGGPSFAPTLP
jgi:hypothetical protein